MSVTNPELLEEARKQEKWHEGRKSFRYLAPQYEKVALALSAELLKEYAVDQDERKLRKNFLALRLRHLKRCLSLYNHDLQESLTLDPSQIVEMLTIQFNQYERLFENEINNLLGYLGLRKWKNKLMLSRYKSEGKKHIARLSKSVIV